METPAIAPTPLPPSASGPRADPPVAADEAASPPDDRGLAAAMLALGRLSKLGR